jgi:hypothetical protein
MMTRRWQGLVIPYHRATVDGRLLTGDTQLTYRKIPFPVTRNEAPLSHARVAVGACHKVVVDSFEGVTVGLLLDLQMIRHPGEYWAQADFSHDFWVEQYSANTAVFIRAELIGFHLGTNPAWSNLPSIAITEEMLEEV